MRTSCGGTQVTVNTWAGSQCRAPLLRNRPALLGRHCVALHGSSGGSSASGSRGVDVAAPRHPRRRAGPGS